MFPSDLILPLARSQLPQSSRHDGLQFQLQRLYCGKRSFSNRFRPASCSELLLDYVLLPAVMRFRVPNPSFTGRKLHQLVLIQTNYIFCSN